MSKHPNLILKRGMITDDTDSFVFRQNAAQVEPDKDPQDTVHLQPVDHINTEQPVLDFALTGDDMFVMEGAVLDFALTGNPDF